jgi:uncharacterized protein (TIGR04255 family)
LFGASRYDKTEKGLGVVMTAGGSRSIPAKLKHDAIVEALFEIRFDMTTIPEVFFGRLAEYAPWKQFTQARLPAYDVPAALRQADPNLRYHPIFALAEGAGRAVRIGPQVLSYHRRAPYVGWAKFKPELDEAIAGVFGKTDGLRVERLGLRYLNALRTDVHGIKSISDLNLKLEIASERVSGNANVNFTTGDSSETSCTVRIATTDFIQGDLPENTSVYVDVDVFTKPGFETKDQSVVKDWIEAAHTREKEQFFRLLTERTIESLKEK